MTITAIVVLAVGTYAFRVAGPLLRARMVKAAARRDGAGPARKAVAAADSATGIGSAADRATRGADPAIQAGAAAADPVARDGAAGCDVATRAAIAGPATRARGAGCDVADRAGAAGGGRAAGGGTDVAVLPPRVTELMSTAATVLLVALIATAALTAGGAFAGVALPAGVLTGGVLAWRRVPFVVVVVVAAAAAAGLRALGVP